MHAVFSGKIPTAARWAAAALFFAGYVLFLFFFNQINKTPIVDTTGRSFVRASVVEVVHDNLAENGERYGTQDVRLKILDGKYKGKIVEATSTSGYRMGAACKAGMEVIAILSVSGNSTISSVYSPNRQVALYVLVGLFLLILWMVGGKKGIRSAAALLFTFSSILFVYLPMIYRGISPFLSAVVVAVLSTVVGLCIIGGFTVKTLSGILGTIFGIVIAGAAAALFGFFAGISGYNVADIDTLVFIGENTRVNIGELLFSGILFASLGAVMDVSYSISSAMEEVAAQNAGLTRRQLFVSGIHVGRDMIGTMCNTLILAFAGGSLSYIVVQYTYNYPFLEIINSFDTGIEIMQSISGSLGVLFAVPLVALFSSRLIPLAASMHCLTKKPESPDETGSASPAV